MRMHDDTPNYPLMVLITILDIPIAALIIKLIL